MLCQLTPQNDPRLLVGLGTSDDAGVYKLNDTTALIQTVDFFTPIVDDPYLFGQIAAANSLSDVYAMGGVPLTAMNIVGFPIGVLDKEVLLAILQGGQSKVNEAGALIVGGHTIDDPEPKYGLSVTGTVHPDKVLTNAGAKPGDRLILTKPLGTGILATAARAEMFPGGVCAAMASMAMLNRLAAETATAFSVHACTDITGFGLLGHLYEMTSASQVQAEIDSQALPLLPEALAAAAYGLVPVGAYTNRAYLKQVTFAANVPEALRDVAFDPQTSGGLLYSLAEQEAEKLLASLWAAGLKQSAIIGKISEEGTGGIYVY
ncbi:MAG: Selenide, water dikinase [Firmicutes bacterium]|nr:Selenide, water dikinase [Bacillota bacterium]